MAPKIVAGCTCHINKDSGQWLIVDIGFSKEKCSCGVWNSAWDEIEESEVVTFGKLVELAKEEVQKNNKGPLNLLIEAPLSVAFQKDGNPTRRTCDSWEDKYRDWYVNAGAETLIAASWLLRELKDCHGQRKVRLFEGFLSFKSAKSGMTKKEKEEADKEDVRKLKEAVWEKRDKGINAKIFDRKQLPQNGDSIKSAFHFLDKDLIPPVIRVNPRRLIPCGESRAFQG